MKASFVLCLLCGLSAASASPIAKVVQMLSDLQGKIVAEGEEAQKTYTEFSAWCEDRAKNLAYEIKTGESEITTLQATINEETSMASSLTTKIEELASSIATNEADLTAATTIREKEAADFAAEEKELVEIVDMLERAVAILEREMAKGGASMMQIKSASTLTQALAAMVQASVITSADSSRLTALVQSDAKSGDSDSDQEEGAPDAAAYEGHSDNIVATLQDILDKANTQLTDSRNKENTARQNFEMLKQSLTDEIKFANKDMDASKKSLAESQETKSTAEGDLTVTSKELAADKASKGTLHGKCMSASEDFEAEVKSRAEELAALAKAKEVITSMTSGAEAQQYGASFLQLGSALSSGTDLANFEAVRFVRDLARKQHSPQLAQLASRMASMVSMGSASGSDPFGKIKGLISDMISKLEGEAGQDASHKAYCDKEMSDTAAKKAEKKAMIEKLSTSIDQKSAKSAQLKEEVAELQSALAKLSSSQAEMSKIRSSEKAAYTTNRADMEQGLEGVKMALKVLNEYYAKDDAAHSSASGAGASIIGLLEVCESDFSKSLAEIINTEESAASAYDQESKQNEIERTTKEQDVKYKGKEATSLDKGVAEANSDREGVQAELDAVMEYSAKIEEQCIAKAEPYTERKARRAAEIDGLKEALEILESETALLQKGKRHLRAIRRV